MEGLDEAPRITSRRSKQDGKEERLKSRGERSGSETVVTVFFHVR